MPLLFGGHNLPPLVKIRLTDLPKFGGAMVPPVPPGTTGLQSVIGGLEFTMYVFIYLSVPHLTADASRLFRPL